MAVVLEMSCPRARLRVLTCALIAAVAGAAPRAAEAQGPSAPNASLAAAAVGADGQADEGSCAWDPRWTRFTVAESIATGSMALGILATHLVMPEPAAPRWQGAVLLDAPTRDLLRPAGVGGQEMAATTSDVFLGVLVAMPILDAGVAWAVHGQPELALQMVAISAQSFAFTFLVTQLTKRLVGRERPYGQRCESGETGGSCDTSDRYQSFLSGHSSTAFTAAGLVCAHHTNMPLYGGGPADMAACTSAVGVATAVAMLRVAGDRHYLSDVLMGAALGLFSGYLLPSFLHYDIGDDDARTGEPAGGTVAPIPTPGGVGFGYQRVWY